MDEDLVVIRICPSLTHTLALTILDSSFCCVLIGVDVFPLPKMLQYMCRWGVYYVSGD